MTEIDAATEPTGVEGGQVPPPGDVAPPPGGVGDRVVGVRPGAGTGPGLVSTLVPVAVVAGALVWSYWAELTWCREIWSADPNYSHGFLVIPVALWILWARLREGGERPAASRPWQAGWPLLVLVLIGRAYFYQKGYQWSASATLIPALACLALTLRGWAFLRRAWPALAFLIFLLPLPSRVNGLMAQPLQGLATTAAVTVLRMTGLWVLAEGNVIFVGSQPVLVAEACNGLSMLMTLAATVGAAALLLPVPVWTRAVLALSVAPIALASNVARIAATAWSVQWLGPELGGRRAHDAAGWLMMPLALLLVLIEVRVLSWLIVEEVEEVRPMLLGRAIEPPQGPRGRLDAAGRSPEPGPGAGGGGEAAG